MSKSFFDLFCYDHIVPSDTYMTFKHCTSLIDIVCSRKFPSNTCFEYIFWNPSNFVCVSPKTRTPIYYRIDMDQFDSTEIKQKSFFGVFEYHHCAMKNGFAIFHGCTFKRFISSDETYLVQWNMLESHMDVMSETNGHVMYLEIDHSSEKKEEDIKPTNMHSAFDIFSFDSVCVERPRSLLRFRSCVLKKTLHANSGHCVYETTPFEDITWNFRTGILELSNGDTVIEVDAKRPSTIEGDDITNAQHNLAVFGLFNYEKIMAVDSTVIFWNVVLKKDMSGVLAGTFVDTIAWKLEDNILDVYIHSAHDEVISSSIGTAFAQQVHDLEDDDDSISCVCLEFGVDDMKSETGETADMKSQINQLVESFVTDATNIAMNHLHSILKSRV